MKYVNLYEKAVSEELGYLASDFDYLVEKLESGKLAELSYYNSKVITTHTWKQFHDGEIDAETVKVRARKLYFRHADKIRNEVKAYLESVENALPFESCHIVVNWTRSHTWGYNPHAIIAVNHFETFRGTCSGCGYDKLSSAVAIALNRSLSFRQLLCDFYEKKLVENPEMSREELRTSLPYGMGYSVIPSLEGAVGIDCYFHIFQELGFSMEKMISRRNCDVFTVRKA